jgi:hypothetical protein
MNLLKIDPLESEKASHFAVVYLHLHGQAHIVLKVQIKSLDMDRCPNRSLKSKWHPSKINITMLNPLTKE